MHVANCILRNLMFRDYSKIRLLPPFENLRIFPVLGVLTKCQVNIRTVLY